jgi:hypothetical protein
MPAKGKVGPFARTSAALTTQANMASSLHQRVGFFVSSLPLLVQSTPGERKERPVELTDNLPTYSV